MKARAIQQLAAATVALSVLCSSAGAAAGHTDDDAQLLHHQATAALKSGAYQNAIDALELLSDRGFVNAAVSFNRAIAYLGRANSPQGKPGDWGQAVAALEEAQLLDPDDREAGPALDQLRKEIAREQAKRGSSPLVPRPSLARAVVTLCHESTWFVLAAIGSGLLGLGLALWFWARSTPAQIVALLSGILGTCLGFGCGSFAFAARQHRLHTVPAVVIASSARLLDAVGTPVSGVATEVSEGALVDVLDARGALTQIAWGSSDGWVKSAYLRRLSKP